MTTNELKKGDRVRLRNGWEATIEDNRKGNIRLATVYGFCTETGSVYAHDIVAHRVAGTAQWVPVTQTAQQSKVRDLNKAIFGS